MTRARDIARRWEAAGATGYRLRDAAGHIIAEVFCEHLGTRWQGYILPREGREYLGVPCNARNPQRAMRAVEGELAGIRSCETERQLIAVRAASPMRPLDRRTAPVDGLALFDHARSPVMI